MIRWLKRLKCKIGYHKCKKYNLCKVYDDRFNPSCVEYSLINCKNCEYSVIFNELFKSYRSRKNRIC